MFNFLKGLSAVLLVLALGPWPYDYYTILRVVVCATSVWCTIRYYIDSEEGLAVMFGILALLFNPISPIYLDRGLWTFFDLGAAGIFAYSFKKDKEIPR